MAIDLVKLAQSISKTGFKLEYEIGKTLRKNGWHLISNRCYIDDLEGTVREIDLLAYKVTNLKDLSLYTVIIISCKKTKLIHGRFYLARWTIKILTIIGGLSKDGLIIPL